jgi:hypothetical protein
MAESYRALAQKFADLVARHTRRNRLDAEIRAMLPEIAERREAKPREAQKLHLLESEIWESLEDPARALASCALAARGAGRVDRDRILNRALMLIGRVNHRSAADLAEGDTIASRRQMVQSAVHELYNKDRTNETAKDLWCAYLASIRKLDALNTFATQDYLQNRNGRGLSRVNTGLTLKYAQTHDWSFIHKGLTHISEDYDLASSRAALAASLSVLCTAHLHYADDSVKQTLADDAKLKPLTLYHAGLAGTRAGEASKRKQIWVDVYDGDESLKSAIVDDLFQQAQGSLRPSGGALWNVVLKATTTKVFWTDEAHRNRIVSGVRAKLPRRGADPLHSWCEAALFAFEGNMEGAERIFQQARSDAAMQRTIERSGAVTFIAAAHRQLASYNRSLWFSDLPDVDPSLPLTLACADPVFFLRHAEAYMSTLRKVGSDVPVHFHLAGHTDETDELFNILQHRHGGISLSVEEPPLRKPYYYATMRFIRLPALMAALNRDILLTDIDVTFHGRPETMFADPLLQHSDAALRIYDSVRVFQRKLTPSLLYRYPRLLPWSHINAACLAIRNTTGGRELCEVLAAEATRHLRSVMELDTPVWGIDQTALFAAVRNTYRFLPHIRLSNVEDIGMPFGSFSKVQPASAFPPVGGNPYLFAA